MDPTKRTKIVEEDFNRVHITFVDKVTDDVRSMRIYAPSSGGYVRVGGGNQICERLACMGNTLYWSGKTPLINLVRKHYKLMRAEETRFLNKTA